MSGTSWNSAASLWTASITSAAPLKLHLPFDLRLTNVCLNAYLKDCDDSSRTTVSLLSQNNFPAGPQGIPINVAVLTPYRKEQAKVDVLLCSGCPYVLSCVGSNDVCVVGYQVSQLSSIEPSVARSGPAPFALTSPPFATLETEKESNHDQDENEWVTDESSHGAKRRSDSQLSFDIPRPPKRYRARNQIHSESSMDQRTEPLYEGNSVQESSALGLDATSSVAPSRHMPTTQVSDTESFRIAIKEPGVSGFEAKLGSTIFVNYVLSVDGHAVMYTSDVPKSITIGENNILPRIDQALVGMKVGQTRVIYVPSSMKIPGSTGQGDIELEIQLLGF